MASESPAGKPENPIAPLSLRRKSVQLMLAIT